MYSNVRDLRILIDSIPINTVNNLSRFIYRNVTSLTLTANKTFSEQTFLIYLYSIINRNNIIYLKIQLDNCSKHFLSSLIENFRGLHSLTISAYQSWPKLLQLSLNISESNVRSLTVYEALVDFDQYDLIYQLFHRLETVSVNLTSVEDCYRLLTLLFIGNRKQKREKLRSLIIKCDFPEPDAMAHWIKSNILRNLSYKCTTNGLMIWL